MGGLGMASPEQCAGEDCRREQASMACATTSPGYTTKCQYPRCAEGPAGDRHWYNGGGEALCLIATMAITFTVRGRSLLDACSMCVFAFSQPP